MADADAAATADATARLEHIPTSTICDAYIRSGLRPPERVVMTGLAPLRPPAGRVVGRARTQRMVLVRDRERSAIVADRELTFRLVDGASPGDFLVVSAPAGPPYAVFGGVLALTASRRGAVGVAVDGAARDVEEIAGLALPVWCAGVTPVPGGYAGYSVAEVGTPVTCGGVEVAPGDHVVADADGVVVVPAGDVATVLPLCEEMEAAEDQARAGILAGRAMVDSYPSRGYYADR